MSRPRFMFEMTEPELRDLFRHLASEVESLMPAGRSTKGRALFALLVFDDPKVCQYVSNAERADMIQALREAASRLERQEDIPR